jgi:hypothetical protein
MLEKLQSGAVAATKSYELFETKEINGREVELSIGFDSYTNIL